MELENINREELQSILTQLVQALHNHRQWYNTIIRNVVCGLKSDRHDVGENPHRECLFGQWYYETAPSKLKNHPGFNAIGEAHQYMHQLTKKILQNSDAGIKINVNDFDNFANAIQRLQIEIESMQREMELMLYTHDPLTGVINRTDMMPILREIHEMSKRNSTISTLAMIDLDDFKKINDKYGHSAGDKVLTAFGHYLLSKMRPYDKVFRFGGEEFLLCMQNIDLNTSYTRCEKLRQELAMLPIDIDIGQPVSITASFGITILDTTQTLETSIENADRAMYSAKSSGHNCIVIWNQT